MSGILVDFPLTEAQGILAALSDGFHTMSPREVCDAEAGRQRLHQAVKVEIHSGGSEEQAPGMEALAQALIGRRVRVQTVHGSVKTGKLVRLSGFRTVILDDPPYSHPINLSLVRSIEAERVAA